MTKGESQDTAKDEARRVNERRIRKFTAGRSNSNRLWPFWVLLSLAAHGLIFFVPQELVEDEAEVLEEDPVEILVSDLPTVAAPKKPIPEPEPLAEELKSPPTPVAEPLPQPQPVNVPVPQPEPQQIPEPEPEPEVEPEPESPPEVVLEGGLLVPFSEDFPVFDGSETGCFQVENCRRISNQGSPRQIARKFKEELAAQYEVEQRDDLSESGYEVFELRKKDEPDAETQYLSIFSEGIGSAVYTITQQPIRLDELREIKTPEEGTEGVI